MAGIEDCLDHVAENVEQLATAMWLSPNRIAETGTIADFLEFGMTYVIADRVAQVTTLDTNENNVDVAGKKVLVVRDRVRARAKAQRTIEKQQDGRRMA